MAFQWQYGDFLITDNLAVAHMAHANTQLPRQDVGLRIMHRTIVRGVSRPSKIPGLKRNDKKGCATCRPF